MLKTIATARTDIVAAEARILAAIALEGAMALDELAAYKPLLDLGLLDIEIAVANLILGERLTRRVVPVRYRDGGRYLRRDVPVYSAAVRGGD